MFSSSPKARCCSSPNACASDCTCAFNWFNSLSCDVIFSDSMNCTIMKIDSTKTSTSKSAVMASTKPGQILASNRLPVRRVRAMA